MKVPLAVPSFVLFASVVLGKSTPRCRCVYGQDCWPSLADFLHLATQISQPVIYPFPPEAACYPASSPSGNCTAVSEGTFDGNWRSDQAGSMQAPNFESFYFPNGSISACYLNTTLGFPCERGSVPAAGVDARSVSDIQAAVNFARNYSLRLVVKNTGHDFLGRSTARGSFLIWTHHLKNITYNDTFVPEGSSTSELHTITLGAGVQWREAFAAAHAQNRVIVGGLSVGGSVGAAGGWVLGGGHSALSPHHGLGVDNVVQFSVVTSTGDYLTANLYRHSDLFWALRGGGGGTYGIVTSVTYRTHPIAPLTAAYFTAGSQNLTTMNKLITEFIRIHPSLSDAGWSGYSSFNSSGLGFLYIAYNVSSAQANATIDPFFSFAQNLTSEELIIPFAGTVPYDSFNSWYTALFSTGAQVGTPAELGSRLFSRELVENDYAKVAQTLSTIQGGVTWYLIAGGMVSKVDPNSTGLNPAWRSALVHVISGIGWPEGTPGNAIEELRNQVKADVQTMENLAPGSGSYFNEASLYEKNPKHTFFGSHYDKLKLIKDIYDPGRLFVVAEGVGSDEWDPTLMCLR